MIWTNYWLSDKLLRISTKTRSLCQTIIPRWCIKSKASWIEGNILEIARWVIVLYNPLSSVLVTPWIMYRAQCANPCQEKLSQHFINVILSLCNTSSAATNRSRYTSIIHYIVPYYIYEKATSYVHTHQYDYTFIDFSFNAILFILFLVNSTRKDACAINKIIIIRHRDYKFSSNANKEQYSIGYCALLFRFWIFIYL